MTTLPRLNRVEAFAGTSKPPTPDESGDVRALAELTRESVAAEIGQYGSRPLCHPAGSSRLPGSHSR